MSLEKLHPKWQSCDDHGDLIAHAEVQSLLQILQRVCLGNRVKVQSRLEKHLKDRWVIAVIYFTLTVNKYSFSQEKRMKCENTNIN